jgi:hypothetical protein
VRKLKWSVIFAQWILEATIHCAEQSYFGIRKEEPNSKSGGLISKREIRFKYEIYLDSFVSIY